MVAITYFSIALIGLASLATASPIGQYPSGTVNIESRVVKTNSARPQRHQAADVIGHMAHAFRDESGISPGKRNAYPGGVVNMERRVFKKPKTVKPQFDVTYLSQVKHAV